ncbi:MAG: hypothetical protein V7711_10315 [Pseudomonadales bacterium]
MSATVTVMVSAQVEAINHETREVSIKREDGEIINFVASEEAKNIDQVNVGDIINATYVENVSIEVVAAENAEAAAAQMSASSRAKAGEEPGIKLLNQSIEIATVEAIDLEANTFQLKTVDGTIEEYTALNPENLKMAAVGDAVISTHTQGLALSLEKATAED